MPALAATPIPSPVRRAYRSTAPNSGANTPGRCRSASATTGLPGPTCGAPSGTSLTRGWCSPYLITPNSASPNGYELAIGDASPCSETGEQDWYLEARVLAGKDLIGRTWAWSPDAGLGVRHLSNGTSGVAGYRTDEYLICRSA